MTNQEIYNKLGPMGSLLFIGVTIAGSDGDVDSSEIERLVQTFKKFAPEGSDSSDHLVEWLDIINEINEKLDFDAVFSYVTEVLKVFKNDFSANVKANILNEFTELAFADGEFHQNEAALLGVCSKYLL